MPYWINPNRIQYALNDRYNVFDDVLIQGGDWDLNIIKFEELPTYKGCYELFIEKRPWKDTTLFKVATELIKQGFPQWSCKDEKSFEKREIKIKNSYEDIIKNGIKEQASLPSDKIWNPDGRYIDEISIVIDRNGHLILVNGYHRLSIAKILKLEKVPVNILRIHPLWDNFCYEVKTLCKNCWGEKTTYHTIDHISFNDYKSCWSNQRMKTISENIPISSKTLLDIGSLFGYFCTSFEDLGLKCTAVENYKPFLNILYKIKESGYYKFNIIPKSIFDIEQFEFDIILALNIFHHFLKKERDYNNFKSILKRLKFKEMFVQFHNQEDPQMKNAYRNYNENELLSFICINTNKNNTKEIYKELDRKIFKIY